MNQAQLTIENKVTALSDSDLEASWIPLGKSFQAPDWDTTSHLVNIENFHIEGPSVLLFFWDGKKVHRVTDERLKEEMTRMIDYSL